MFIGRGLDMLHVRTSSVTNLHGVYAVKYLEILNIYSFRGFLWNGAGENRKQFYFIVCIT